MSLPYNTLTPILGEAAIDHTPESETTPEFMNGKFGELLANDKKLYEQINDCLEKSIATKTTTATKIADIYECGVYSIINGSSQFTDYPTNLIKDGLLYGELVVSKNNYINYELTVFNGNYGSVTKMYGVKNNDTLLIDWQPIATTTKTPFSLTAMSGYEIVRENCYKINERVHIDVEIKKTDGSVFTSNTQAVISSVYKLTYPINGTSTCWDDTSAGASRSMLLANSNCVLFTNGRIFVNIPTNTNAVKSLEIMFDFDI